MSEAWLWFAKYYPSKPLEVLLVFLLVLEILGALVLLLEGNTIDSNDSSDVPDQDNTREISRSLVNTTSSETNSDNHLERTENSSDHISDDSPETNFNDSSKQINLRCDGSKTRTKDIDIPASGISDITSNPDKHQEETKSRVTNSSPTTTTYTKLKLLKEKEVDDFFDLLEKERISNIMRERNRKKKFQCESPSQEAYSVSQNTASMSHGWKNEQGLIREMILSKKEKHMTEISANLIRPNNETSITPSILAMSRLSPDNGDIISLYKNACNAEVGAIKANQEEILHWCFYARKFKSMYKDFMVNNKVEEKKAKGQVEICEETLEERPIGPEKYLLDVSNDRDSGYECDFKDVYDNDEDDSQTSSPENGRHEAMTSPKYPKTQGKFSPPENGRHEKLQQNQ
ncbi:5655_t:CDS:2 [Acaulospora morrowiae]|uniref:5655_t:CDS:1 n=1 Tax=Acaulospora morrowiae TaxID=94023 RepID=A0A9N8WBZ3_9GLOM|nr:5655_t:CDS:2 [Acaulospora morrowiae]